MKTRIVLVDDHASVRDMLVCILKREPGYEVVGEAGTGLAALRVCEQTQPDLVILDLILPELSGLEIIRRMTAAMPAVRLLVYSGAMHQAQIIDALKSHPHGYVAKSDSLQTLRDAIAVVTAGGRYFSQCAACFLSVAGEPQCPDATGLTCREREILQLVAEGGSNKEIAQRLGVSCKTVENHRARLMGKLQIHDVATLTRYAVCQGIVPIQ